VASRRAPRNLRVGLALGIGLILLGLIAPLLATDLPWIVRSDAGLRLPALAAWSGLQPRAGATADGRTVLRAPIPYGPAGVNLDDRLRSPGRAHWLGTDALGRDLAARILHGARVSISVGLLAALFALALGLPLGALAGYFGGWTDACVSRAVETVLCFPGLLLALALLAAGPAALERLPDVARIALVVGVTGWIPIARYLRGEFMKLRRSDMVTAVRAAGATHLRIMVRHILPGAMAPVLVTTAFAIAGSITLEASLSFLGLGVRIPQASWGGLLADAVEQVDHAWWLGLFPGLALFLAILACNLVGEGLRDYLDPRQRTR